MSKFTDCWGKIAAKDYRHRDGTRVLTAADKRAILSDIDERIKSGDTAVEAATAAVTAQIEQVRAQRSDVFKQAGVSFSRPLSPEADAEYMAAVERGDMESAQRMVDEAAKAAGYTFKAWHGTLDPFKDRENKVMNTQRRGGFWVADTEERASFHGAVERVFIRLTNPTDVDLDTIESPSEDTIIAAQNAGYDGLLGPQTTDDNGGQVFLFNPNQIKSADPVTRDDQGNVIPLSQRFNAQSNDIRFSTPLALPGPTEPTGPTSQVFGRSGTAQVEPGSMERARAPIREKFFDSTQPVSEDQTLKAMDLVHRYMGTQTGSALSLEVQAAVDPRDQNLANGVLRSEMDAYGLKMLEGGDPTLFNLMQRYATTDFVIGMDSENRPITYRRVAQELAGNSRHPGSAAATARDMVNTEKRKANTKVLGEKAFDEIASTVDNTKLDGPAVASIADTPLPKGGTLRQKVEKLAPKGKRKVKPKEIKKAEEDIAKQEDEAKKERAKGESLLYQLAKSQSDTPPAARDRQADEVRKVYREALTKNYSDEVLRGWIEGKLEPLGVPDVIRAPLIEAIVRERTIRRAIRESEADVLRRTEKLATGEAGSLKGLEQALTDAPDWLQRSPAWRRRIILDYFMQTGIPEHQAKIAARAYEALFAERLGDATKNAVEKLLGTKVPWAQKIEATRGLRKKAITKEIENLIKAVRLELTDPTKSWDEETARRNKWNGFTAQQHQRLQQIDRELMDETTPNHRRALLIHEVNKYITAAGQPPSLWNTILASYVASALGGLSTFTVQPSAHVGGILSTAVAMISSPGSAVDLAKAFAMVSKTTATETEFAARTGAYRTEILDNLKGYEKPLEYLLNEGRKNFQSSDPVTRLKGAGQMLFGLQEYTMRALNSIDQGFIVGAKEMTALIGTREILARLGLTREQLGQVIGEAMRAKADLYELLVANGTPRHLANADATDSFMRRLYETVANREGTIDGMTMQEWADDIQRGAELEAEGRTGRISQGISPYEEGFLRKVISYPLAGITKGMGEGGGLALYLRSVYGFMAIPFRTAAWYAGYSPYGFVRYGLHKAYTSRNLPSPYAQSYGSQVQVRQRLREAWAGTITMAALAALAKATSDDDDETPNALFVTGGGPGYNDPAYRDAWMKKYKPYSIILKIDGQYYAFNYGRLGESLGWAATLAGSLDDVAISRKNKSSHGAELDKMESLVGNLIGNFAERSAFKGLYKVGETIARARQPGTTDRVVSQLSFAASSIIPWKSAMNTIQRVVSDPVDNEGVKASILASVPVAGPLINKPRINVLGDPSGDLSAGGRAFSLGIPSFGPGQSSRAYDLILQHGRGPSSYQRNDFAKRYEDQDSDTVFYEFTRRRGRKIKAALEENYERLKTADAEVFGEFLRRLTRMVNETTAAEMKLKPTTVE